MRFISFLILLFFSITVSGQIKISKANGVVIGANKTFAIEKGQVTSFKDKKIDEGKVFASFKEAATNAMTLRGYQLSADSSAADLIISYYYEESISTEFQKTGPASQVVVDDSYQLERSNDVRTLIIDIEKNKSSIWTANCRLDGRQKNLSIVITTTVEAAFKKFPLQGKKK